MYITHQKGEIAALKVQLRAIELGCVVSRPTTEARYDIIVDDMSGKLYRAQIKYADGAASGAVVATLASAINTSKGTSQVYSEEEVDILLLYVPKIDEVLWIPAGTFVGKTTLNIRLEPSRNNQTKGVNMASDFIWNAGVAKW